MIRKYLPYRIQQMVTDEQTPEIVKLAFSCGKIKIVNKSPKSDIFHRFLLVITMIPTGLNRLN